MTVELVHGDCLEAMRSMPAASFSAVVTDPPYGLEFMGREWDTFRTGRSAAYASGGALEVAAGDPSPYAGRPVHTRRPAKRCAKCERQAWSGSPCTCAEPDWQTDNSPLEAFQAFSRAWGREALRLVKPGGVLLAFGGARTFHRLACGLEDAGWEVRDTLAWIHAQGFPKSLAVDQAIDRQRHDRADVLKVTAWVREARDRAGVTNGQIDGLFGFAGMAGHWTSAASQPAVPTLEQVPALLELLGQEPPEDVARLMLELNGRKGTPGPDWFKRPVVGRKLGADTSMGTRPGFSGPAHSGDAAGLEREFDVTAPATAKSTPWAGYGTALRPAWEPIVLAFKARDGGFAGNALRHGVAGLNLGECGIPRAETGFCGWSNAPRVRSAASDFLAGSPREQKQQAQCGWPTNLVLDEEVARRLEEGEHAPRFYFTAKASTSDRTCDGEVENLHPTVKPTSLMAWCVRLVKMPAGATRVLEPFAGSGSTVVACAREQVDCVAIERDAASVETARRRLVADCPLFADVRTRAL